MTGYRKAQITLMALRDCYNRSRANGDSDVLLTYFKGQLKMAVNMYNLLTNEECCIEEDKYGGLELYIYNKEE